MAIQIESPAMGALRGASNEVKQMAVQILNAEPAQIEAAINALIADPQMCALLTVVILALKSDGERIRAIENTRN
jgi:hypothetical protein